jgi:Ni/Fe-hydrogenase subunit HybB-like protein
MLELAVKGNKWYWGWVLALLGVIGAGFGLYLKQLQFGLGITGMSRDVSWGFYIANFTYLVGVAAGGVMVVLPYYLHDYKAYGRITILGEFLAIASIVMCLLFILVDLGQPMRASTCCLYPTPQQRAVLRCHRAQRLPVPEPWWAGTSWKPSATAPTTRAGSNR